MPTDRRRAAAGIDLTPGAKMLATSLPPPASRTYPPGAVIAEFAVPGRPVPWSVPPMIRRKSPRLVAWQRAVNLAARVAMAGRPPHDGPVILYMVFSLCPRGKRRLPDATNLGKATEDAIQGAAYLDDNQVVAPRPLRSVVADESSEGVDVLVVAYDSAVWPTREG